MPNFLNGWFSATCAPIVFIELLVANAYEIVVWVNGDVYECSV